MSNHISAFNDSQTETDRAICDLLDQAIKKGLPQAEGKLWHAHPVWFLDGNPIVGYRKLKRGVRLMFWSGASFGEAELQPGTGKFKDASMTYASVDQVNIADVRRWLKKSRTIQWDYKNVVKHRGVLKRLKS
jgi:hypothetical protein